MSEIKTAGDLRTFLAGVMVDIRDGKVNVEKAGAISKVAAQINQSLAAEVSAAIQLRRMDNEKLADVSLSIGGEALALEEPKWCEQCERRVTGSQSSACKDKFCKAKGDG